MRWTSNRLTRSSRSLTTMRRESSGEKPCTRPRCLPPWVSVTMTACPTRSCCAIFLQPELPALARTLHIPPTFHSSACHTLKLHIVAAFGIIHRCLRLKRTYTRTRRSHAPKPTPGAICTVCLRGCGPSRMRKKSPHRPHRRTRSASTRTFGRSSARSNRPDKAREASCTSTASSASGLPARPLRLPQVGQGIER